ncbi:hypothetical protein KFL_000930220 [Klebsormidium nitens]|uniref:Uncharacterized protein n=1 Tax=Klebsormidium nitens TaxID=105231 RepID=A0A1Y1HZD5_KLENI|nr:hypothetical protein KFL_000930220 [Klebsormidium nitens]|eukprot:GAQ81876.1 hypothetical protein KFL_000930220 [Klebsormidium nitens]
MLAFVTLKSGSDAPLLFTTLDVKHVTDFFTSGFFQHLRLYQYCLTKEQAHLALQEQVMLETAELGFPPLSEAMTEAERDDWQASRAAAAAAAEAERRARAEAEEAARLAAVEAARIAAEEEAKKRKPQTLEEAVEFAVRDRLAAERKAIEEEHAKREKELLDRIAQLEAARAKMAGDGGNKSRGSIQG